VRRAACTFTLLALCGCSGPAPTVQLIGGTAGETTAEATRLDFELRLANPDAEPLSLRTFEYELHVDGRRVYRGKHSAQATLSRGADRTMHIPAVIPHDQAGWAESGLPASIRYELHGALLYLSRDRIAEILFDARLRRPRVGFSGSGEIPHPAQTD
jgi:hypothetical protein